ncbi:MAG TPA: CRISPR-associated endonuclease Cas1 [Anaerolineae bacterium]|nr:CRISPR-associated endonuclease Cas1 [Anaerolineae bacterium]
MHLIVDQFGSFIGKKSERLRVTLKGEVVQEIPFFKLKSVMVIARGVSISSDAIYHCVQQGIPVNFLSYTGKPYARVLSPHLTGTVRTRREQLLAYEDGRGVALGRAFAVGKLSNQANLLKYMAKYRKGRDRELYRDVRDAAIEIQVLCDQLQRLEGERIDDLRAPLMNLEGRGASIYWEMVGRLLRADVHWPGREHRGAQDPVNAALNYGYGILYSQVEGAIILAGLDPYAGFVHVDRPGKPSLVLDLIEEFRQPVVDRTVFGLVNKGVAIELDAQGRLIEETRKLLATKVLDRLEGRERYEGKKHKLRVILHRQAQQIATFVRRERGEYRPFVAGW